jgi:hypothetical protein
MAGLVTEMAAAHPEHASFAPGGEYTEQEHHGERRRSRAGAPPGTCRASA